MLATLFVSKKDTTQSKPWPDVLPSSLFPQKPQIPPTHPQITQKVEKARINETQLTLPTSTYLRFKPSIFVSELKIWTLLGRRFLKKYVS